MILRNAHRKTLKKFFVLRRSAGILILAAAPALGLPCFSAESAAERAAALLKDSGAAGGLIAHVGCGDGSLIAALAQSDAFIVHGLDADAGNIEKARQRIRAMGLAGRGSVERFFGRLPYADNTVNLLILEDGDVVSTNEIVLALRPLGIAYISAKSGGNATKIVKPMPQHLDEWTHFLRAADNNAVSQDTEAGPPFHMQWTAPPAKARSHEHLSSMSAMVSAGGRLFYIVDEGPAASVQLPSRWMLVARDAFNGKTLWKGAIPEWITSLRAWTSGPVELGCRLVAAGERVFVTLGFGAPVSVLAAASGAEMFLLEETKGASEIACAENELAVVMPREPPGQDTAAQRPRSPLRAIAVFNASDGQRLWRRDISEKYADLSLAVRNGRLVFREDQALVCLDLKSGEEKWRSPPLSGSLKWPMGGNFGVTVVATDHVILHGDGSFLTALSARDGAGLWSDKSYAGHCSPADLFVINGLVWNGEIRSWGSRGFDRALNLETGAVARKWPTEPVPENFKRSGGLHHRCHRNRATVRYIMTGRVGAEFIDLETNEVIPHNWVRGACQFGYIPANGLLYFPVDPCICYTECLLTGITALAPRRRLQAQESAGEPAPRLEKGPAFESAFAPEAPDTAGDWPTYRHDPSRSGVTKARLSTALLLLWKTALGGRLSSVTAAGGRVDSPPTIARGRAVFGCVDGYVYCLRAEDGALAWRFRAAPEDRRIISFDQLESVRPVHGSVLAVGDALYFAAGRNSYLDGGIHVFKLDPASGEALAHYNIYSRDAETGAQPEFFSLYMRGAQNDIMSADDKYLYLRHFAMDFDCKPVLEGAAHAVAPQPHLFSPTGFLDDSWWHRTYWLYGTYFMSSWGWWAVAGNCVPAGLILCVADDTVYGYGRNFFPRSTAQWEKGEYYQLFAADKKLGKTDIVAVAHSADQENLRRENIWARRLPFEARAMALAADTLFAAGPVGDGITSLAAFEGREGVALWAGAAGRSRGATAEKRKEPI